MNWKASEIGRKKRMEKKIVENYTITRLVEKFVAFIRCNGW